MINAGISSCLHLLVKNNYRVEIDPDYPIGVVIKVRSTKRDPVICRDELLDPYGPGIGYHLYKIVRELNESGLLETVPGT